MTKIKIENFGPIKKGYSSNDGWMEIKKNTFLIGDQGSGKSTVAKLFSMLTWLEKAINRGDLSIDKISIQKFIEFAKYQKIQNYFKDNSYIAFKGDKYIIEYDRKKKSLLIDEIKNGDYVVPKIMYIPSERNFLSTISSAYFIKGLPDNVFTFAEELKRSQKSLKGQPIDLNISSYKYEYDEEEDNSFIVGEDYRVNLLEASSGLQSYTPLYLVSRNLSHNIGYNQENINENISVSQAIRMTDEIKEISLDNSLDENLKKRKINKVRARYYNKCFVNIVEEPEQNLFPESQWELQKNLFLFNNINKNNKLFITTHSPYLINYLPIAVKGFELYSQIQDSNIRKQLNEIIPNKSTINPKNLVIYELDKSDGSISKLEDYKGLPSDENYLNNSLGKSNELFVELLEIEDKCK